MAEKNIEEKRDIISSVLEKVKMKDAGMKIPKPKKGDICCSPFSDNGVRYPSLYLDIKQAPDLSGYDVGDKVTILMEAEVVSHSADKSKTTDRENFEIKILKIGCKH
jgi:hypothetical protein